MDIELEARIAQLLLRAARRRKLVPYGSFHAIFPPSLPLNRRYTALEKVTSSICSGAGSERRTGATLVIFPTPYSPSLSGR